MDDDREIKLQIEDLFSDLEDPVMGKEDILVSLQDLIENVTERKQAHRQRVIFHAVVENATDAIIVSDLEGRQTYSNRACYEIFGYDYERQEMDGLPLTRFWSAEDASMLINQVFPRAKAGGWSGEVRQKRRDGALFDAHLTVFPVLDRADQPISIAAIIRDISERKAWERELDTVSEQRVSQVQLVSALAQEITAASTLDELYRRLVTRVEEHFGYYHVRVYRYDLGLDAMVLVESYAQAGRGSGLDHRLPGGAGIVGAAAITGKPVLVPDVTLDPRWMYDPDFPDAQGELAVPIRSRTQEVYVLDVLSDRAGALTREDEVLLLDLGGRVANAMDNIRQLEEANVIRQFSQAADGIGWITLEGHIIIYMNSTLGRMLGEARPENAFGKPLISYYPKNLRERVQNEILPAAMREGQWVGELAFLSARGQIIPTIQSIFLVRDENKRPLYLANVATDISEQKQVELLLDKRARQVSCLNEIGRKIEENPQVPQFLQWIAKRISLAVQYQEICVAAVEFNGQIYGVAEALNLPCRIAESLYVDGERVGQVCIAYTQRRDFAAGEGALLGDIARQVGGYIESRRIFEQTQAALDEVKAAHQVYMPERWDEPASTPTPPDEPAPQHVVPLGEDEPETRLPGKRVGATLREAWQRISTGVFILGGVLVLGALLTWTIRLQMYVEPPTAVAMAQPTLIFPATATPPPTATDSPSFVEVSSTAAPITWTSASRFTPSPSPSPTPSPSPSPSASPSPSPAPPVLVVPSPFPTLDPSEGNAISTTLPVPTPVSPVPVASDAVNIVVMGSDQRPDWSEWHTDAVHVVSIQRERGTVSVLSIPRDIYLYIPGFWMSRINFADYYGDAYDYKGGGPALVRDTLLYNLGIRMDHYVRTNFDGLIDIVNTAGGVDVPVHCSLGDYWPYPDENGVYPILTMEPGLYHMDGETALWYARSRKTTSVFSRERRQQQVLQALWHKARDVGMLTRVPALWRQGQEMIETDLTLPEILDLTRIALSLEDQNVRFYNIGADEVIPWTTPYGGSVFLPNWEKIQPIVAEAMAPVPEARLIRIYMPVEVWNGTSTEGWGWLAADRLYRAGFPVVMGEADRQDYAKTQLIVYSERVKGTGAESLQQMFDISEEQVIYQPEGSPALGFRLILGDDYQTCPEP